LSPGARRTTPPGTRTVTIAESRTITIASPADAQAAIGRRHSDNSATASVQAKQLVPYVERCWARAADFTMCMNPEQLPDAVRAGFRFGVQNGTVGISAATVDTYTLQAVSMDNVTFSISRDAAGHLVRTCAAPPQVSGPRDHGCSKNGTW
jgi:hypothetical protein